MLRNVFIVSVDIFHHSVFFTINKFLLAIIPLTFTWFLQYITILQTKRWIAKETRKRFNFLFIFLALLTTLSSIVSLIVFYEAVTYGYINLIFYKLLWLFLLHQPFIWLSVSEYKRLYEPFELASKDPFALPGDFPLPYIERRWHPEGGFS